jgi:branched-chain amino acid transport system ATP-binding protein
VENNDSAMLATEDLYCSLGGASILNGISVGIKSGETVGIIGPNGSGKTTLFNCISGFAPVTQGKIFFRNKEMQAEAPFRRAEHGIGRIFQNFGIFREMTVLENVLTAIEGRSSVWSTFFPWGRATRHHLARAKEFLRDVGLEVKAAQKASSLSGGQMRLLEIVRTLAYGAELFLLDEPTAGVSPKMKEEVAGLIKRLQQLGKTVVIIEHDINFIQKFCGRILVLDSGRVVLDDVPEKVRSNKLLQEIYFGKQTNNHPEAA